MMRFCFLFLLALAPSYVSAEILHTQDSDCISAELPRELSRRENNYDIQTHVENLISQLNKLNLSKYEFIFGKSVESPTLNYTESCVLPLTSMISGLGLENNKIEYFQVYDGVIIERWIAIYSGNPQQKETHFGLLFSRASFPNKLHSKEDLKNRLVQEVKQIELVSEFLKEKQKRLILDNRDR